MPTMQPRKCAGNTTTKLLGGIRLNKHSAIRTGTRGGLSRMKGMREDNTCSAKHEQLRFIVGDIQEEG